VTTQLGQFKKDIQEKEKIISDLEQKLNAQTQEGMEEAGLENAATVMTEAPQPRGEICSPGRVDISDFDLPRVLGLCY
jgi:hypothetical protein